MTGAFRAGTGRCSIGQPDGATLADAALPGNPTAFDAAVAEYAHRLAGRDGHSAAVCEKQQRRESDERRKPLEAYRAEELAEMSRDLFTDRNGFAAARHAFVTKQNPSFTPHRLARHRPPPARGPPQPSVRRPWPDRLEESGPLPVPSRNSSCPGRDHFACSRGALRSY